MKLLLDENLPGRWVAYLNKAGFEAEHWLSVGPPGESDDRVWDHALAKGRILLTSDLDFSRMLAQRQTGLPSVIQLRDPSPLPEVCGTALIQLLQTYPLQLQQGCLISFSAAKHRVRMLPLGLG